MKRYEFPGGQALHLILFSRSQVGRLRGVKLSIVKLLPKT